MPRKESMERFAKRRGSEMEAKMDAKENPKPPMKGKDSPDSKGPTKNAWTKGNKPPKEKC